MTQSTTPCAPTSHLTLPFFDAAHQALAEALRDWVPQQRVDERDDRRACQAWVRLLGNAGWLRYCVPAQFGGALDQLDSRALVILRETLAYHSPLADFAFAMQGLGSGAITLAGTPAQQAAYLPAVARGDKIAAFALSEPDAGSDVGAMQTVAACAYSTGAGGQKSIEYSGSVTLNGSKTWISNGGIADFYCVFAKTDPQAGTRGISAFIVDAGTPGLDTSEHIEVMAPHPLATLKFADCRLPASAQLGELNGGFKLAMRTLDIFRASVAGAALGMARRALAEAVAYAQQRPMFGQRLADFQLTQAKLGEMAALIDAGALLTYRAAWLRDCVGTATPAQAQAYSTAAAMAKMTATENAQRVIDMALQLHGGMGVKVGTKIESLYRDIRALRIYEGATEVQQLIIGKAVLKTLSPTA
ncbi:MAG: acyl-CoA dehydrogenase family protein [Rhodoferax sp.]|nr:acyl-CoA dehydrogenase family protein [Rhodoferax sp.]